MDSLPTRDALMNMRRIELQKLCKDRGMKANLKSEALIDLLLDAQQLASKAPLITRRSVSTRLSSRAGPSRTSSVVIHDTDIEEDEDTEGEKDLTHKHQQGTPTPDITPDAPTDPTPLPAPRTRKAKELQTRLGVGRPVAAGGSGPRAVTKSLSVSRGKRSKTSRTVKPTEATIFEEEPEAQTAFAHDVDSPSGAGPSNQAIDEDNKEQIQLPATLATPTDGPLTSLAIIDMHVADALRPLHEQMKSLKSELALMESLKTELEKLKAQVAKVGALEVTVEALATQVEDLRAQATVATAPDAEFKSRVESRPLSASESPVAAVLSRSADLATNPMKESNSYGLADPSISSSRPLLPHPGIAPTMLGKRHRDSTASNATGVVEESQEEGLLDDEHQRTAIRPLRKRAKISQDDDEYIQRGRLIQTPTEELQRKEEEGMEEIQPALRMPSFTIFSGSDEPPDPYMDLPPPKDTLPDIFARPSPLDVGRGSSGQSSTATSTVNAPENRNPFRFSFFPVLPSPAQPMYMPSFPYPEPPQSPSPAAGINTGGHLSRHQGEITGPFQSFGLPPASRLSQLRGASGTQGSSIGGGFVNPAALTRRTSDRDREDSTTDVVAGIEPVAVKPPEDGSTSASASSTTESAVEGPLMKRTMYGTELDGDTRFGDFGVEGVGSSSNGFWAGGRY